MYMRSPIYPLLPLFKTSLINKTSNCREFFKSFWGQFQQRSTDRFCASVKVWCTFLIELGTILFGIFCAQLCVLAYLHLTPVGDEIDPCTQFQQPYGTKRKCAGSHSLALVSAILFHQQKYAQLYKYG